jgi:HEAT repeat protein
MCTRKLVAAVGLLTLIAPGCGKSIEHWKEQMKSPDSAIRLRAVHALQERVAEPEVARVLAEALSDEDTVIRRDAARALGRARPSAADIVFKLQPLLNDKEPSVRKAAANSIKSLKTETSR